jgi:hypothetical protein
MDPAWKRLLSFEVCHLVRRQAFADMTRGLLDGTEEVAEFQGPADETMSLHTDLTAARETMEKIRILERERGFHTALAHDASWLKEGTDQALMSLLDDDMKAAAKKRIPYDEIP